MKRNRSLAHAAMVAALSTLVACSGGGNSPDVDIGSYSIGGTVAGLENGLNLVVAANGGSFVEIVRNGSFSFPDAFNAGSPYVVSVVAQPSGQTCLAEQSTGTVARSPVANISIKCATSASSLLVLVAGQIGSAGFLDGVGSTARFDNPTGLAFDASDNLLVADSGNSGMRRISPSGVVTTLAAEPNPVNPLDSTVPAAPFRYPIGIAMNSSNVAYVSDLADETIRTLSPSGQLGTLAGASGVQGWFDGAASLSRFNSPVGIVVDRNGNTFVADQGNHTIRRISRDGIVSTFAGSAGLRGSADGSGQAARFDVPTGLCMDAKGNLFVTDQGNHTIRKITPDAQVSTFAGSPMEQGHRDGARTIAQFSFPSAMTVDKDDNLFVWDSGDQRLRKLASTGDVSTVDVSHWNDSPSSRTPSAVWGMVGGMAVDRKGNLFAAHQRMYLGNAVGASIRKITASGNLSVFAGVEREPDAFADGPAIDARFNHPQALAIDPSGALYVTDDGNGRVRKIDSSGQVSTFLTVASPSALAFDRSGALYVARSNVSNAISKVSADGSSTTWASDVGYMCQTSAHCVSSLGGVAFDPSGALLVADTGGAVIYKISPSGIKTIFAGAIAEYGNQDGVGAAARFGLPQGIAVSSAGDIFVSDNSQNTIRKISPAGVVSTVAGSPGEAGSADGLGANARFSAPGHLAIDEQDNLYIADSMNSTIRKMSPSGLVTTIAGVVGKRSVRLGTLPGQLSNPSGLAVFGGNLFVADENSVLQIKNRP